MIQPIHFTYQTIVNEKDDLRQGDIISRTKAIQSILKEVHPHFLDSKSNAFLVLTQTCDLVRREKNTCKTRYINLAVVRPLSDILCNLLDKECKKVTIGEQSCEGLYTKESKSKARMLLQRIINQNEQAMGLFYLHNDAGVEIPEPSVALLQVSIAVRAKDHYDNLVTSRRGRLSAEFQSKLGWLIGNLFSRVASPDWPSDQGNELINELLGLDDPNRKVPRWVSEDNVRTAEKGKIKISGLETTDIIAELEKHKPTPKIEVALGCVKSTLQEVAENVTPEEIEMVTGRLKTNAHFSSAFK